MRVSDVVSHHRRPYHAKDFDSQQSHMMRLNTAAGEAIEVGVYLHWLNDRPVDVAIDVSCMAGCTQQCHFCAAAELSDTRLSSEEIEEQVDRALSYLAPSEPDFLRALGPRPRLTISFEGMGEPTMMGGVIEESIANLKSRYRETFDLQFMLSTMGAQADTIVRWASSDIGLHTLQVSLHGTSADIRFHLLHHKSDPEVVLQAVDEFANKSPETEIKVNYLLVDGVNDQERHAEDLCRLLSSTLRRTYFLKISLLNPTASSLRGGLKRPHPQRYDQFFQHCLDLRPSRTYRYGTDHNLEVSCGQLASYARLDYGATGTRSLDRYNERYAEIYESMRQGHAVLFLGAGSSASTAEFSVSLGKSLQDRLDSTGPSRTAGPSLTLTEVADIYTARGRRLEMFTFIKQRLQSAPYPPALKQLTRFPWRAIFTTNYDDFVERAYQDAAKEGLTTYQCAPIYEDRGMGVELSQTQIPLIKLHGCVTQGAEDMVISAADYQQRYLIGREFLLRWLEVEAIRGELIFIGYSLRDHFIGDLLAYLKGEIGMSSTSAFAVHRPDEWYQNDHEELLMAKFNVRSIPATLDQFIHRIGEYARRPVVMFSGSARPLVSGSRGAARENQHEKMRALAQVIAPLLAADGVRTLSGATSSEKFGWMVAAEVLQHDPQLPATYLWTGVGDINAVNVADEVDQAPKPVWYGVSAADVIDRLVELAQVAVFAGGSALTLPEFQQASAQGLLIIPIKLGDQRYVSDVINAYFAGTVELLHQFDADPGYREKVGRTDWTARLLTADRLQRLDLSRYDPEDVADTVMEIIRAFRWLALAGG